MAHFTVGLREAASRELEIRPPTAQGANYNHVFSPTFLTEARVGVAHLHNQAEPNDSGSATQQRWVSLS